MASDFANGWLQRRRIGSYWPWLLIGLAVVVAAWHVVDFEEDVDREFPQVERPIFSKMPPAAYRLAEPGDTLDRITIYLSSCMFALAGCGLLLRRGGGLWASAAALSIGAFWYSATPGPTFDGWHGLGWRVILDARAPATLRIALSAAATTLLAIIGCDFWRHRAQLGEFWSETAARRTRWLWISGGVLAVCRQFEIPGVEPVGYWPRCAMVVAMMAVDLALLRAVRELIAARRTRFVALGTGGLVWFVLVAVGIGVTWYHRPLARLKEVVPGKIFISAMPTRRGLEVADGRHHFRTIINLFPEETAQRSSLLPQELAFVKERGVRFISSPSQATEAVSNAFLDETLAVAQDPSAWPILIHCHGCMDRSPAWMGIYRFVVERRPLAEIMTEIERHRGYRPKASVTLLYNRVLPPRAPEHYWSDPTALLLRAAAHGTVDPLVASSSSAQIASPVMTKSSMSR